MNWVVFVLAVSTALSCAAALAPEQLLVFLGKEGLAEDLTNIVLIAACGAWWFFSTKSQGRDERRVRRSIAVFCIVLLGEELDWGGVFALWEGFNLHNSWSGTSYTLFQLPFLTVFASSFSDRWFLGRIHCALGAAAPTRLEIVWCALFFFGTILAAILAAVVTGIFTDERWERALDEAMEFVIYVGLLASAVRGLRAEKERTRASGRAIRM